MEERAQADGKWIQESMVLVKVRKQNKIEEREREKERK